VSASPADPSFSSASAAIQKIASAIHLVHRRKYPLVGVTAEAGGIAFFEV
jgi:hypothetical protein